MLESFHFDPSSISNLICFFQLSPTVYTQTSFQVNYLFLPPDLVHAFKKKKIQKGLLANIYMTASLNFRTYVLLTRPFSLYHTHFYLQHSLSKIMLICIYLFNVYFCIRNVSSMRIESYPVLIHYHFNKSILFE